MNTALEVHGFRRERSGGRAILALVMVAVAAIVGISWLAQVRLAEHTRHDLAANLAHARDAAHTALRTWRAEEEQAVTVWANSPAVQRLTVELLAAPRTHEALLAAPAQARLRRLFEPLRAVRPYHGFFIIAPDGRVVFRHAGAYEWDSADNLAFLRQVAAPSPLDAQTELPAE